MSNLRRRIDKLEQKTQAGKSGLEVVLLAGDLPPEEEAAALEEAQRKAGPSGLVLVIERVEDWRHIGT